MYWLLNLAALVVEFSKVFDLLKSLVLINLLCHTKPTACIIINVLCSSLSFQLLYSEITTCTSLPYSPYRGFLLL